MIDLNALKELANKAKTEAWPFFQSSLQRQMTPAVALELIAMAEASAAKQEPFGWVIVTGHGSQFSKTKPKDDQLEFWTPIYAAPSSSASADKAADVPKEIADEREEFEKWARGTGEFATLKGTVPYGRPWYYFNDEAQDAWLVWQARAKLGAAMPGKVADEREAFEAAQCKYHWPLAEADLRQDKIGNYYNHITQANWSMWQSRAALAHPAPQQAPIPAASDSTGNALDWVEDYVGGENQYECKCSTCNRWFYGHKHRVTCKMCAAPQQAPDGPLTQFLNAADDAGITHLNLKHLYSDEQAPAVQGATCIQLGTLQIERDDSLAPGVVELRDDNGRVLGSIIHADEAAGKWHQTIEKAERAFLIAEGTTLQKLGARLTELLDDDQWNNIEPLLLALDPSPAVPPSDAPSVPDLIQQIKDLPCERTMSHFATTSDMALYQQGHSEALHSAAELAAAIEIAWQSRLREAQKDAERYRYIRDAETLNQVIWDALEGIGSDEPEGYRRGMDNAVDAAIAASQQEGKDKSNG